MHSERLSTAARIVQDFGSPRLRSGWQKRGSPLEEEILDALGDWRAAGERVLKAAKFSPNEEDRAVLVWTEKEAALRRVMRRAGIALEAQGA